MKKKGKVILGIGIGTVLLAGTLALGITIAPKVQEKIEDRQTVEYVEFPKKEVEPPKFQVFDIEFIGSFEIVQDGIFRYVTGKIKNTSTMADAEYLEIEFNCYDINGNYLGQVSDRTFGLKQGETWKYSATLYYDEAYTIKFNEVYFK